MRGLNSYGIVPGLSNIKNLCGKLGDPQDRLQVVHIAGTNGKGSVLAFVSNILQCAGYRVGRYVSPAIFEEREIIQINQRPISREKLCRYTERVKKACEELAAEGKPHPTRFEFETALAFLYFAESDCQVAVLETGMGGRQDATNVITRPAVCVFASISMDHMKFLGNTLEQIGEEKAGIIKPGCPVVTMNQDPSVMAVLEQKAGEMGCSLKVAHEGLATRVRYGVERQRFDCRGMKDLEIHLAGKHQISNAVLALEVIRTLTERETEPFCVGEKAIRQGLSQTRWPGRLQVIGKKPLFLADGAHNEEGARKLADSIRFYFTNRRIIYIIGVLKDKEYEKILAETYAYADQIITVTTPDNPRALPAYELARAAREYHPRVTAAGSLEEAVEMAYLLAGKEDVIISFGSLSYLGRLPCSSGCTEPHR